MQQTLDADELAALAQQFNDAGDIIRQALNDPSLGLSGGQIAVFSHDLTTVSNIAMNLATRAAQLTFEDGQAAFRKLSDVMSQANDAAAKITADAKKITNVIGVIAAVVSLGTALGSGSFTAVGTAINGVIDAVNTANK